MSLLAPPGEGLQGADSAPTASSARVPYEPALDGLRALAVIAVMAFHSDVASGGFLGVDIFFVLSGFLIVTLVLRERERSGRMRFGAFYGRRIRRLLPAFIVVLFIAGLYTLFFAQPEEVARTQGDAVAAFFSFQNWHVIQQPWTKTSVLSPTWSLSAEVQWYLVAPILLSVVFLLRRTKFILAALIARAAASVIWTFVLASQATTASHVRFGTETRGIGFLIGAIVGFLVYRAPRIGTIRRTAFAEVAGVASLLALVGLVLFASDDYQVVGRGGGLLVALATAAVIVAALQPSSPVIRPLLGWRPLVVVGLVSYGVYLFHMPIFRVLIPDRVHVSGIGLFLVRAGVTIAVASLTFFLLERPIRNGVLSGRRGWAIGAVACVAAFALLFGQHGDLSAGEANDAPTPFALSVFRNAADAPDGSTKALVIGDVQAASLGGPLAPPQRAGDLYGLSFGSFNCGLLNGDVLLDGLRHLEPDCKTWPAHYGSAVDAFRPDVAVLLFGPREVRDRWVDGQLAETGTSAYAEALRTHLARTIDSLEADGARVLLLTMPCSPFGRDPAQAPHERVQTFNATIKDVAASRPGRVQVADLDAFLCNADGTVRTSARDYRTGSDQIFSPAGIQAFWTWLTPQINNSR